MRQRLDAVSERWWRRDSRPHYTALVDSQNKLELRMWYLRTFRARLASSVVGLSRVRSLLSRNRPGENDFLGTSGESHLSIGDGVIRVDRRLVIDQGIPSHTKCGSGRKLSVRTPLFGAARVPHPIKEIPYARLTGPRQGDSLPQEPRDQRFTSTKPSCLMGQ